MLGATSTTSSPKERRRAQTRAEILDAAWELCRERGLAGLSLRDLAARVGMRAPSPYSYFGSKDEIYDAIFAQGQRQLLDQLDIDPANYRGRDDIRRGVREFFEFCISDQVRYQLLFQRTIPGFEPSAESYGLAVTYLDRVAESLRNAGLDDPAMLDLLTALVTGLIDQQFANDPGGDRWARLLDDALDMFFDHTGIPDQPGDDDR